MKDDAMQHCHNLVHSIKGVGRKISRGWPMEKIL